MNTRKLPIVILIPLVLIVFAYAGYLALNTNHSSSQNITPVSTSPVSEQPQTTTQSSLSTEEKDSKPLVVSKTTYRSAGAGYEITYPTTWTRGGTLELNETEASLYQFELFNNPKKTRSSGMVATDSDISIMVIPHNEDCVSFSECALKDSGGKATQSEIDEMNAALETITIGGSKIEALKEITTQSNKLPAKTLVYTFMHNKRIYYISFESGSEKQFETDYSAFISILNSIRFI